MSSIPTKQIDGDISVGRNVSAGGNANIQGHTRIGHNLRVEGWLEARNLKTVNKGLFKSRGDLEGAYPQARLGWYAGVEATNGEITALGVSVGEGKTLYRMYLGAPTGKWEAQDKLYEINVELTELTTLSEDVSTLQAEHEALEGRVTGHDGELTTLQETTASQSERLTNVENRHDADMASFRDEFSSQLMSVENRCMGEVETVDLKITDHIAKVGQPGGVAELDNNGRVPSWQLPGYVDDVVEFQAEVSNVNEIKDEVYVADVNNPYTFVLWLSYKSLRTFVLAEYHEGDYMLGSDSDLNDVSYIDDFLAVLATKSDDVKMEYINGRCTIYKYWGDDHLFTPSNGSANRRPYDGKLYINSITNEVYRWSGSALVKTNSSLALGETSGSAYPGNLGKQANDMAHQANTTANEALDKAVMNSQLMTDLDIKKQDKLKSSNDIVVSSGDRMVLSDSIREQLNHFGTMNAEDGTALANEVFNLVS